MKKFKVNLILILSAFVITGNCFAQEVMDLTGKNAVAYRFSFINEDDQENKEDIDLGNSFSYLHMFNNNIGAEAEASYLDGDDKGNAYALFADLIGRYPLDAVSPYVRGGVGLMHSDSVWDLIGNIDDSLSARLGIGIEYIFHKNFAADVESVLTFSRGDVADSLQYRFGIKCYF